jgi:CDP-diglyceride synthetase
MVKYIAVPLLAFVSMFIQDVFGVWLVRAENAGHAHAAARWDVLQDAARIAGFAANTDAILISHNLLLAVITLCATFLADYGGSYVGVTLGVWLEQRKSNESAS